MVLCSAGAFFLKLRKGVVLSSKELGVRYLKVKILSSVFSYKRVAGGVWGVV